MSGIGATEDMLQRVFCCNPLNPDSRIRPVVLNCMEMGAGPLNRKVSTISGEV